MIRDSDLADRFGYSVQKIRNLIRKMMKKGDFNESDVVRKAQKISKTGRPRQEFWLTKKAAQQICEHKSLKRPVDILYLPNLGLMIPWPGYTTTPAGRAASRKILTKEKRQKLTKSLDDICSRCLTDTLEGMLTAPHATGD